MAFKDFVQSVKNEAGDAVGVTKQKARISKEKTKIKENYEQIGKYYYETYAKTAQIDDAVMQYVNEITQSKKAIDECNAEIEKIKEV
ncbi:MAG: hypothetical protein NC393_06375 [Clostridium sp.]|nr:hypothetical protein [Clostridium sp.]MCM1171738.1 hypothetical protein [Clostridium sp.]MCM1208787.1 hypothetical protein [Ruminococcus sp.]